MSDKALEVFGGQEILSEERLSSLVEDLKDIVTEGVACVREKVIETKWEIGDRLFRDEGGLTKDVLSRVIVEVKIHEAELFRCLAFRKKFPTLKQMWTEVPEGKNVSWHKLVNDYIDFTMPKPATPMIDKFDDWGIIDWWLKNKPHAVRLRDKNSSFALVVKAAKAVPDAPKISELYKEIGTYFIEAKKWQASELARDDFARMNKSIKTLLEKAKGDKEKVKKAIKWCADQYKDSQIDWTLETVIKKFPETSRIVKPYEKYLKKRR